MTSVILWFIHLCHHCLASFYFFPLKVRRAAGGSDCLRLPAASRLLLTFVTCRNAVFELNGDVLACEHARWGTESCTPSKGPDASRKQKVVLFSGWPHWRWDNLRSSAQHFLIFLFFLYVLYVFMLKGWGDLMLCTEKEWQRYSGRVYFKHSY